MHPILFEWGPLRLYTYGLCFAVGVLLGAWLAGRQVRREADCPLSAAALGDLILAAVIGGVVGGRLLYILLNWPEYAARPWEIIALWHGGLIFYGGFVGGVLAACWYAHRRLTQARAWSFANFLRVLDLLMPSLAIAQSVGRLGCFFNGCCYGRPTTSAWGMMFPGAPAPLYPTQLLESLATLILFVVLRAIQAWPHRRAPLRPGLLIALYLILYGTARFAIEFLRGDNPHWWLGLTLSQWLGLAAVPLGFWLLLWRHREKAPGLKMTRSFLDRVLI